ncbi:ABC transporter permease [Candidatus Competibacter phosphatis]|uniref:ABC transporter permease n=2 Tax=Candidatus Competibacter phosphatis TaxID=221280 RepID=A0ABX1TM35_9GAMM|nr:ABC transporter permease [Candidatus Competibacter phosphatis]
MLLIWELTARYSGWSPHVFPSPSKVVYSMGELIANGALLRHSIASLFRVTVGFYLAVIFAIPLGIFLGRMEIFNLMLNPLIQFLRPISPLAWIPLAVLWFGIGDKPAVFLIFLSCFFPSCGGHGDSGSCHLIRFFFQVAANFKFNHWETITKIILPAIMPNVLTALRLTMGIGWLVVVAAEMLAVRSGLGYLILDSRNALRMDYVMVGMMMIGLLGIVLDELMRRLVHLHPSLQRPY